ncbi:MAG: cytidylate kinase [Syntrophorhabdus sp. PtaU1.Bin058]|nr:MAG: cytidylate kinase [Syntrophorhabdus sp. PtaU1.Bin058]
MWENICSEKCKAYIESHFHFKGKDASEDSARPAITISRAEGAGGLTVASELADYLQENVPSHEVWTVFSRYLVAKVLEEHNHRKGVGDFMKEDRKAMLIDAIEELLGLHPSTWTLVEQTNATILRLAKAGNVILVGRGSSIVTGKLRNVFHVRLTGSLEKRIEQAQKVFGYDRKTATEYIKKKDQARRRYIKHNFDKDIDDPLLYHVTINTDLVAHYEAARLVGNEVIKHFKLDSPAKMMANGNRLT